MLSLPDPLMRRVVLYVDSLKIGGAERVTLTFARWLRQNGWDPIVLTRQSVELDFYPIPAGVERAVEPRDPRWLRLLGRWGFPWRVLRLRSWLRRASGSSSSEPSCSTWAPRTEPERDMPAAAAQHAPCTDG